MKWEIYNALNNNPFIQEKSCDIKFYEYPDLDEFEGIYIVIDAIDTPLPTDFADNKWLAEEYFYQIEVWSLDMALTEIIAREVRKVLYEELSFGQYGTGLDEWDKETGIYRDARRYRGKNYLM